jgi:hypothetical protein
VAGRLNQEDKSGEKNTETPGSLPLVAVTHNLKYLGKNGRVCKFIFQFAIALEKGRPSSARAANPDLDDQRG